MRIEDSYPAPVLGVSTLAPRNRMKGHASAQINMRSDPVQKLTRRPPLRWDAFLLATENEVTDHSYFRNGKEYKILLEDTGAVHGYVDNVKVSTGDLSTYGASTNVLMKTINDTTFVVNKGTVVTLGTDTDDATIQKASHINVTSALNYGETLTVEVFPEPGNQLLASSVITIPAATDATNADVARRTNQVAEDIATDLNVNTQGITAAAQGSAVAIWRDTGEWIEVKLSSGSGDDVQVFNQATENIAGLPLYARVGTRIKVQPDPTVEKGIYYLEAIALNGTTIPAPLEPLVEVVWTEARSPDEPYALVQETMPHTIRYDYDINEFVVGVSEIPWDERATGDNESCPVPKFVGRTITSLGQFQKRLVLLSGNDVEMTVTDNLYNWWKQSAITLLVSDPIGITSNSVGIDILQHVVEHNRDLLAVASNGQFKIDGTVGLTPQTVAMPLTVKQEVQVSVEPITLGASVYLPINYGESTGLTEYVGARDSRDETVAVTDHIIGYMPGKAKLLVGSPNLGMIAMTSSGAPSNHIFIYEEFREAKQVLQKSWSTWTLPEDNEIIGMSFRRDILAVTVRVGGNILIKSFALYSRIAVETEEVLLNDFLTLDSADGTGVVVPEHYPVDDIIIVGGAGSTYPLFKIPYTRVGDTITFNSNVSGGAACKVYIGTTYYSGYSPTRPFRVDDQGTAVTTDRLRINRYRLNVVNTEKLTMRTHTEYTQVPDQKVSHRVVNRQSNRVGEINLFSGDVQFSYSQNAAYADVEFFTDGWLGLTITSISWLGQYFQSSKRIK